METIGKAIEVFGIFITAGGLIYAWWRADRRAAQWRRRLATAIANAVSEIGRFLRQAPAKLEAQAEATTVAVGLGAGAKVSNPLIDKPYDRTKTVAENWADAAARFRRLESIVDHIADRQTKAADAADKRADKLETDTAAAIAAAIAALEKDVDSNSARDLTIAIGGIVVQLVGIALGLIF